MLGGVDIAGTENNRKQRHQRGNNQCGIRPPGANSNAVRNYHRRVAGEHVETDRDGLQLQRYVGQDADHHDDGHDGGNRLALAEPRCDKVGDGGNIFRLGDADDLAQYRKTQSE